MELEKIELYGDKYRLYINDTIKGETIVLEILRGELFEKLSNAYYSFAITKQPKVDS